MVLDVEGPYIKNGSVDGFVGTTYGIFRVNAFFPQLQLR
jgi:hypothetical protein